MKRSSCIQLVLIGSSLVFLSACDQKPEESKTSKAIDTLNAPHPQTYMSKEDCEKVHGEGKCNAKPNEAGGGNIFMPMVAGYMLGSMLNKPATPSSPGVTTRQQDPTQRGGFGGQAKRYFNAGG